jgi:putative aldouronate transport system substrate-binding protein
MRDQIYGKSVSAAPADFDTVWEEGLADYLSAGGQDIIDERTEKWDAVYSSDNIR